MRAGGKVLGGLIIIATVLLALGSVYYTQALQQQRETAIEQLATIPQPEQCEYEDIALCPQAEQVVVPNLGGIGMVILGIIIGAYLIVSDTTQRKILDELGSKREQVGRDERYDIVMSVLTGDEQRIVAAVREQPGISQATLRLRTDMSKAKLSMLLKELERRGLITKVENGKTNSVHLKREL